MLILGIETSCDETAASLVKDGTKILSNVVASSVKLHQKTGGIIPEVAAREQLRCIIPVIKEAIESATINQVDALTVTVGPGLIGSLLVGVETAKALSFAFNKPLIPVNHLQAHLYANWLNNQSASQLPKFPAIGLVVSGGHTDLVLMEDHAAPAYATRKRCGRGNIKWLGGTRDDAAGECFDKTARALGLGYPGGPAVAAEAAKLDASHYPLAAKLPRPMINDDNFDFSFSGLKTAVLKEVNQLKTKKQFNHLTIQQLTYEIQEAITDVLVAKTLKAAKQFRVKSILVAGGVAANQRLREKFHSQLSILNYQLYIPAPALCTDNATYVAASAFFKYQSVPWQKIVAQPGLSITSEV